MSTSAITRLQRVLDLEEKQGWRNRAVIGGLLAMGERWQEEAHAEEVDATQIAAVMAIMAHYDQADQDVRPTMVEQMRAIITGEIADLDTVLDQFLAKEEVAETTHPARTPDADKGSASRESTSRESTSRESTSRESTSRESTSRESTSKGSGDKSSSDKSSATKRNLNKKGAQKGRPTRGKESAAAEQNGDDEFVIEADAEWLDNDDFESVFAPPQATHLARARLRKQQRQQERVNRSPHDLQAAPTMLNGVGDVTAEQLARLGIHKVVDLLWHLPTRHEDYSQMRTISQLQPGEQVTIIANLWEFKTRKISMKREMVQGILADGTGTLHATWWNKYIVKQLTPGSTMRFSGKVGLYMGQKTLDNPIFEELDDEMVDTGRLAPVYRLTEGLSHKRVRDLVRQVLDEFVHFMSDPLPAMLREEYQLPELATALQQIHFPDNQEQLAAARRRLAFEELFYIQLGVLQRRRDLQQNQAPALSSDPAIVEQFTARLPFQLTGAQQRVLEEIRHDLQRAIPMTRLVQGDVGSGKTAVAAGAMWIAAVNGLQSALLAPTQILAEQHYRGISRLLEGLSRPDGTPLTVALLTGRVTGSERDRVLTGLQSGEIDIIVGTTALIQEQVEFQKLGFAVVDEQHRFGVEQRGALRTKNDEQPHLLVMSATPIPRSLAMTVYGDLDVSAIDEMPPGRMEVKTKWFRPRERERLYGFLRREVQAGRQGFIVYPLVEESEKLDVGSAVEEHKRLSEEVFPDLRLALLHGRMSGTEKDEVMSAFAAGNYDLLVSTSVIEVGIDVPNASVIVIEDAERFGLAQLHQFRGRVGRGEQQSYCALISKADNADAEERLRALEATNNGFELAEKDLELRGPGEFLGTRQSGLPELRIAHLSDVTTLALAREAAQKLFAQDPELTTHSALQKQVWRFWRGHGDIS
ncbi:MAG: ATP-dependent DNA helicase RecG [Caldilineaceae bacterium]